MDNDEPLSISDLEFIALVDQIRRIDVPTSTYKPPPQNPSPEQLEAYEAERELRREEEKRGREERRADLRLIINSILAKAYHEGSNSAISASDRSAWNARSITLYLVVLALVGMPFLAIATKLEPQAFGSYIAPVTGIAGTVVGYWFGSQGRSNS